MAKFTAITGTLALALAGLTRAAVEVDFPATLDERHANVVQDNYLGISWELSAFDTLCESSVLSCVHCTHALTRLVMELIDPTLNRGKHILQRSTCYAELPIEYPRTHLTPSPHSHRWQFHGLIHL